MTTRQNYIFLGIGVLLFLYWIQLIIRYPIPYDITEGVLLHRALLLSEGGDIYPAINHPPYFATPYTPLFLIITAGLAKIFGISLWLGRIVSIASFLGAIAAAAYIIRERCDGYLRALSYMLLTLLSYHIISNATLFTLQWTGVFFSILGLAIFPKRPLLAFFVMSLGILTKQSQLMAPLTCLLWLAMTKDWKGAFRCGLFFCLCVALELLLFKAFFGEAFFRHTFVYTVGTYSLANLERLAAYCLTPYFILVVIGGMAFYKTALSPLALARLSENVIPAKAGIQNLLKRLDPCFHRDDKTRVFGQPGVTVIYLVLNFLWLFAAARVGSDSKYFLEFYVALFMVVIPFVHAGSKRLKLAFAIQLVLLCAFTCYMFHWNGLRIINRDAAVGKLIPILKDTRGDIIVEDPALAILSGHRLYLEPFPMSELSKKGLWDEGPLIKDLTEGRVKAVVIQFDIENESPYFTAKERFTSKMREAIRKNFRLQEVAGPFYLYVSISEKLASGVWPWKRRGSFWVGPESPLVSRRFCR